jgi:transcriptional regulator
MNNMYTPAAFRFEDRPEMIRFMQRYSFATIITCIGSTPVATMIPFVIAEHSSSLLLRSHFSALNTQAKHIEENESLVIFNGPHAYISPAHYDKKESVPTWDYITVQARGKAQIVRDELLKKQMLEEMISFYDQDYQQQWETLPEKYVHGMMKGLVAFELQVESLAGQQKLSQNKTIAERNRIADELERSADSTEKELAAYIKNLS